MMHLAAVMHLILHKRLPKHSEKTPGRKIYSPKEIMEVLLGLTSTMDRILDIVTSNGTPTCTSK